MLTAAYAEGVSLRSPGSPRSGAPWVTNQATVYAEGVIQIAVPGAAVRPHREKYGAEIDERHVWESEGIDPPRFNACGVMGLRGMVTQGALRDPGLWNSTPSA